jgi:DNA-binding NarL/FixJ family response regulator
MPAVPRACSLTKREGEVLSLLVQGLSNKQIAVRLKIGTNTVKHYINGARVKLLPANSDKINSRVMLAKYWSCELFRIGAGRNDP